MNGRRRSIVACILLIMIFSVPAIVMGQVDTLVRYDIQSGLVTFLEYPVPIDTPDVAWTTSSPGFNPNILDMESILTPPLFPESNFSELGLAQEYLDVEYYPASANAKIWTNRIGLGGGEATGVFIRPNLVLTTLWYVYETDPEDPAIDSVFVYPAYDNGEPSSFGRTEAIAVYMSINAYNGVPDPSLGAAIMETAEPLGDHTGWVGIQYCQNDSSYLERSYFEFGYPNSIIDGDTTERYNGDSSYYAAGQLEGLATALSYGRPAMSGQSGSALLSIVDGEVLSVGYLLYSYNSIHRDISYPLYCAVNHFFEPTSRIATNLNQPLTFEMGSFYPNPFNGATSVAITLPASGRIGIAIYNINGERIHSVPAQSFVGSNYSFTWNPGENEPSGVYVIQAQSGQFVRKQKVVYIK